MQVSHQHFRYFSQGKKNRMKLNSMYWTISTRQVQWTQAHFIDIPQEISTILDTTFDKTKHPQSQGERKKKQLEERPRPVLKRLLGICIQQCYQ
jgi:hypothetical protein